MLPLREPINQPLLERPVLQPQVLLQVLLQLAALQLQASRQRVQVPQVLLPAVLQLLGSQPPGVWQQPLVQLVGWQPLLGAARVLQAQVRLRSLVWLVLRALVLWLLLVSLVSLRGQRW